MKDFRDLTVWQKAHRLTLDVYRRTASFPRDELYGLTSQLRRSASSVAANLAEGCGRNGGAELARSVPSRWGPRANWTITSCWPKTWSVINAKDHEDLALRATELKRMLTALLQKLTADR